MTSKIGIFVGLRLAKLKLASFWRWHVVHQKGFMRFLEGKFLLLALFLASHSPIWGIASASEISPKSKAKKENAAKAIAQPPAVMGSLSMSTATNTLSSNEIVEVSGTYTLGVVFNLAPIFGYAHSANFSLGYVAAYTHEMEGDRAGDFIDPIFGYGLVLGDHGIFKTVRVGIGGLIPANKETRNTSMQAAFGPNVSYIFDLGKVAWMQRWGYRHAWFEYDTEPTGKMNFPETFSFGNILTWLITKKWSLGLIGNYAYSLDYNDVDKSGTEFGANVTWNIAKNISTTLGVLTRSGTLAPTGDFHRLNIYDPNRALGYWDLALTF